VYRFLDLELPSDYYKWLVYDLHEENKALKRMNKISGVMEDSSKSIAYLIVLSSDSSTDEDMNKGPSVAKVPEEGPSVASVPIEGPSIRKRPYVGPELAKVFKAGPPPTLLEWFGYSTVDEYLEDTFFDSTDNDTTDNNIMDDYISDVFDSPKSKAEG
ncbi:hypothetical protein Tco_1529762, partial [Tanacetum coccineum]